MSKMTWTELEEEGGQSEPGRSYRFLFLLAKEKCLQNVITTFPVRLGVQKSGPRPADKLV